MRFEKGQPFVILHVADTQEECVVSRVAMNIRSGCQWKIYCSIK